MAPSLVILLRSIACISMHASSYAFLLLLCSYANQMVVEYNVQCQAGKLAFIQFDSLDLEPKNCYDGTTLRSIKITFEIFTVACMLVQHNNIMCAGVKIM